MAVTNGLALFRCEDRATERRQLVERLEVRTKAEAATARSLSEIEGQAFQWRLSNGGIEIRYSNPAPFPDAVSRAIPRTTHHQTRTVQLFNTLPVFYLTT